MSRWQIPAFLTGHRVLDPGFETFLIQVRIGTFNKWGGRTLVLGRYLVHSRHDFLSQSMQDPTNRNAVARQGS